MADDIFESADKIAKQLEDTAEFKSVEAAVELIRNDPQTVELYKRMDLLQNQLMDKQAKKEKPTEEEINEYKTLEQKLGQNPTMANLLKEEKRMYQLLNKIQGRITKPIGKLYQQLVK
jgi:cell fate (sporulation/competence/biofilm development) regulator YlbF (YheA/YmcA/DUF963 family)